MIYSRIKKHYDIQKEEVTFYGDDKLKVKLNLLDRIKNIKDKKLILVTSINPTSVGEGKTTTSIALAQGLKKLKKNVMLSLREPSLGPVFGLKGGATGAGVSSLVPAIDIDLHFTGDLHAITSANNLLASVIDSHIYWGNELKIKEVYFSRCLDINDRSLRKISVNDETRSFVISAASEIMAILALTTSIEDLKNRISDIVVGVNDNNESIYARDLGCVDSLVLLLKDSIKPNLVLSTEGVPAFVHCGPFANIAHGCSSVLATKMSLKLADYTITEAGFGADLGLEKFLSIKSPIIDKIPDLCVVVVTIKALKMHGGVSEDSLSKTNTKALIKGISNLEKHIENIKGYGLNFIIAINKFDTDSNLEINTLKKWAKDNDYPLETHEGFSKGGNGSKKLAELVLANINNNQKFIKLYDNSEELTVKLEKIAKKIYGAEGVTYSKLALRKIEEFKKYKYPICVAKTPSSLSCDKSLLGRPNGFNLEISNIKLANGSKMIVCLTKGINTMPGLGKDANVYYFRVDDKGDLK